MARRARWRLAGNVVRPRFASAHPTDGLASMCRCPTTRGSSPRHLPKRTASIRLFTSCVPERGLRLCRGPSPGLALALPRATLLCLLGRSSGLVSAPAVRAGRPLRAACVSGLARPDGSAGAPSKGGCLHFSGQASAPVRAEAVLVVHGSPVPDNAASRSAHAADTDGCGHEAPAAGPHLLFSGSGVWCPSSPCALPVDLTGRSAPSSSEYQEHASDRDRSHAGPDRDIHGLLFLDR